MPPAASSALPPSDGWRKATSHITLHLTSHIFLHLYITKSELFFFKKSKKFAMSFNEDFL